MTDSKVKKSLKTTLLLRDQEDTTLEIGIDEAGRGPLWGPLTAAAVCLPMDSSTFSETYRELLPKIQDSKKISEKKRNQIADSIKQHAVAYGIGMVSAEEIDTLGATRANQLAFRRALQELYKHYPISEQKRRILVDGTLPLNDCNQLEECKTIVDGDATYVSIAAASILAKTEHDKWVIDWCSKHTAEAAKYDLLNCKGYGTKKHREGILSYGYTELHRRLYLRKLIPDIVVSRYKIIDDD